MRSKPRIAYFTAGSVGAGHLVRGVALGRALAHHYRSARAASPYGSTGPRPYGGGDDAYRIFSPPSPFARIAEPWLQTVPIETDLLRRRETAQQSTIARALTAYAPDLLVIDLFWVPLALVQLPCPAWLLLRSVPPAWLVGPAEARFDSSRYERVFAIEPAPGLERFEQLGPIVVAQRTDVVHRDALASLVGAPTDAPLRLIARAGIPEDQARLLAHAHELDPAASWQTLDLSKPDAPFPAAAYLASMRPGDLLVAGAGYNSYWEARSLGFDQHTSFVPLPRKLDDQAMRAGLVGPMPAANGAELLARALLES